LCSATLCSSSSSLCLQAWPLSTLLPPELLTHYAKGTRSHRAQRGVELPRGSCDTPGECFHCLSASRFQGSSSRWQRPQVEVDLFLTFPHGTCSLSIQRVYLLGLGGAPPLFRQNVSCSVVLNTHHTGCTTGLVPSSAGCVLHTFRASECVRRSVRDSSGSGHPASFVGMVTLSSLCTQHVPWPGPVRSPLLGVSRLMFVSLSVLRCFNSGSIWMPLRASAPSESFWEVGCLVLIGVPPLTQVYAVAAPT